MFFAEAQTTDMCWLYFLGGLKLIRMLNGAALTDPRDTKESTAHCLLIKLSTGLSDPRSTISECGSPHCEFTGLFRWQAQGTVRG